MANILFLAQRIPYPPNKGDKLRAYQVLQHWTNHHRVFLGCFVDDPEDWQYVELLQARCSDSHFAPLNPKRSLLRATSALLTNDPLGVPYYRHSGLANWVSRILEMEKPDCAFIYSSVMAQYVLRDPNRPQRVLMDFVDVDSEKWSEYAATKRFPARQVYRRESRQLLRFDRRVALQTDASIFVSEPEAALFRERSPETRDKVHAISNGIDTEYFSPDNAGLRPHSDGAPIAVFTGRMDYWPNVDAVIWFSDEILPQLRSRFPDFTFLIVGAKPSRDVRALSDRPGVFVTGTVPDVRPYIGQADIVVAPMRISRGIQNKVLEGMAMARPVIVTPQALEGIDAVPDKHLLLACDSDEFVKCAEACCESAFALRIGAAARQRVLEAHSWETSLAKYDQLLDA